MLSVFYVLSAEHVQIPVDPDQNEVHTSALNLHHAPPTARRLSSANVLRRVKNDRRRTTGRSDYWIERSFAKSIEQLSDSI